MELEDQRLLWEIWLKSYQDHKLDFIDWLHFMGYEIKLFLVGEDAKIQMKELAMARIEANKNVQPIRQNKGELG